MEEAAHEEGAADLADDELAAVVAADPRSWNISVVRTVTGTCDVDIEMWTEEEGRSDLTLQVELTRDSDGSLGTTFENLHVL